MIEVYNKYDKLEISFNKTNDLLTAIKRCQEYKIQFSKMIRKTFQRLFTYYCTTCKKRSYFENLESDDCCKSCKDSLNLYFVGFKQTDKLIEEVFYADKS